MIPVKVPVDVHMAEDVFSAPRKLYWFTLTQGKKGEIKAKTEKCPFKMKYVAIMWFTLHA